MVGVLAATTVLIAQKAIGDWLTIVIGIASLLVITFWKKLPEPIVILATGLIGLLAYPLLQPQWLLQ